MSPMHHAHPGVLLSLSLVLAGGCALPALGPSTPLASQAPTTSDASVLGVPFAEPAPIAAQRQGRTVHVSLTARVAQVDLGNGQRAEMLTYNGQYPGPTLDVREGDRLVVNFTNELTEPTSLHWHGVHVPADQDDATHTVPAGGTRTYEFDIPGGSAGTYWYHPHLHGTVAPQVAKGLLGALRVRPEVDPLPASFGDSVAILSDLRLDSAGRALGPIDSERANGFEGDRVLVNGQRSPMLTMRPGEVRRLRLVNASASRYFRLATPGQPLTLVATDGGYIERPTPLNELLLVPGERAEVLLKAPASGMLTLQSLEYNRGTMPSGTPAPAASHSATSNSHSGPGHFRVLQMSQDGHGQMGMMSPMPMMSPMMGGHGMGTGMAGLLKVMVQGESVTAPAVPDNLRPIARLASAGASTRTLTFSEIHERGAFFINDQKFNLGRVDVKAKLGTTEVWSVSNKGHMDHPFHLHGFGFQVLDRNGVAEPFVSWKDTVNIKAGETVRFAVKYSDFPGTRVFHCHILDHEDLGMMGVMVVEP